MRAVAGSDADIDDGGFRLFFQADEDIETQAPDAGAGFTLHQHNTAAIKEGGLRRVSRAGHGHRHDGGQVFHWPLFRGLRPVLLGNAGRGRIFRPDHPLRVGDANSLGGGHFFGGGIDAVDRAFITAAGEAGIGLHLRIAVGLGDDSGPHQPLLIGRGRHQPFRHIAQVGGNVVNLRLLPIKIGAITDHAERQGRKKQSRQRRKAAARTLGPQPL
ncbi:hypothetical protein D3C78_1344840 [compost metagenome]